MKKILCLLLALTLALPLAAAAEEDGELLFGFANTSPGQGHINSLGHRVYAEAVYALIAELEG